MRVGPPQTGHRTGGSAYEDRRKEEDYPTGSTKHNTEIVPRPLGPRVVPMLLAPSMNRMGHEVKHLAAPTGRDPRISSW